MNSDKSTEIVQSMFASIAPTYKLVNDILSFGRCNSWRKTLVNGINPEFKQKVEEILDVATGTCDMLPLLIKKSKKVIGLDFCAQMLEHGSVMLKEKNLNNIELIQGDALKLAFSENRFDAVTCAFGVRNFADTELGLAEMKRVLKSGGTVHILEFGQPTNFILIPLYKFYQRFIMPFVGGVISGNKNAYRYLPETSASFPCREEFCALLTKVGFKNAKFQSLDGGIVYLYTATR
jgi:demethylmenaquinone methyltransferase / 2-methoxy-6-polyprenyl-1,4-benzoquinol methylase